MDIGIVGTEDFALGFKMVGVRKTFEVRDDSPDKAAELESKVEQAMADEEVGILVMHGDDFALLDSKLRRKVLDSIRPVFVPIGEVEDEILRKSMARRLGRSEERGEE